MHESGVIRKLIESALVEARRHDATLLGIDVRLGVLAGGSPAHLRDHFEREIEALGIGPVALNIHSDPTHPGGVEITGVELGS